MHDSQKHALLCVFRLFKCVLYRCGVRSSIVLNLATQLDHLHRVSSSSTFSASLVFADTAAAAAGVKGDGSNVAGCLLVSVAISGQHLLQQSSTAATAIGCEGNSGAKFDLGLGCAFIKDGVGNKKGCCCV